MKFEHLIEINDLRNPTIAPLTRAQLWRGLVLRAEEPTWFMPHLDACEIIERSEAS
ncbi:MAG: AtaL-like protein, partial [Burkholderiaceae bacterium]|nr:AtaL-like protein [Burkholderiaceae bacterium]